MQNSIFLKLSLEQPVIYTKYRVMEESLFFHRKDIEMLRIGPKYDNIPGKMFLEDTGTMYVYIHGQHKVM